MEPIIVAVIAFFGGILVSYITNIIAVEIRRFQDGTSLAAALAGELSSHAKAMPLLRYSLTIWIEHLSGGNKIKMHDTSLPTDPIFDDAVPRLGLLGHKIVEDTVYTYQQIRAFRSVFVVLVRNNGDMTNAEQIGHCRSCIAIIDEAHNRGATLIPALQQRALENYDYDLPGRIKRIFSHV